MISFFIDKIKTLYNIYKQWRYTLLLMIIANLLIMLLKYWRVLKSFVITVLFNSKFIYGMVCKLSIVTLFFILLDIFISGIHMLWNKNIRVKYYISEFLLCIVILLILIVGTWYLDIDNGDLGNALISLAISSAVSFLFADKSLTKEKNRQFDILFKCYHGLKYFAMHKNEENFEYIKIYIK